MSKKLKAWFRRVKPVVIILKPVVLFLLTLAQPNLGNFNSYVSRWYATRQSVGQAGIQGLRPGQCRQVKILDDGTRQTVDSNCGILPLPITLPDGSVVTLCCGSSLCYGDLQGKTREVTLIGQAEFEVTKIMERSFIVHTTRTTTFMLGTRFNVMDFADEPAGVVTLLEGEVEVVGSSQTAQLRPSQRAVVMKDRMMVRSLLHPEGSIGWKDPNPYLEFEDVDLNSVLQEMAHSYHAKIINGEKAVGIPVNGRIRLQNTLEYNLGKIEDAEDGKVRLKKKGENILVIATKHH